MVSWKYKYFSKYKYSASILIFAALLLLLPAVRGVGVRAGWASGNSLAEPPPVLVGAGDIADCGYEEDEATAKLLDNIAGTVFTLGDNVYQDGTAKQFSDCYGPTWGRHKARTRPAAGNHDYHTSGAAAYFNYFGAAAGQPGKGYYSYDLADWHIIVLNSECSSVGGCQRDSIQGQWLQADLAANRDMYPGLLALAAVQPVVIMGSSRSRTSGSCLRGGRMSS
jgi:hypothetical protein